MEDYFTRGKLRVGFVQGAANYGGNGPVLVGPGYWAVGLQGHGPKLGLALGLD